MTDMACAKLMEVESVKEAPSQQQQWETGRWMDASANVYL
jgi:hypothetical protein